MFFEPKRRYWEKGEVDLDAARAADPASLWQARVVRPGTDLTLVAYGPMVRTCLEAAGAAAEEGRDLEVLDLRSLSPLDVPAVLESVRRTRRAVVVHEAPGYLGLGRSSPPGCPRTSTTRWRPRCCGWPASTRPTRRRGSEEEYLPDLDRVLHAVDRSLAF